MCRELIKVPGIFSFSQKISGLFMAVVSPESEKFLNEGNIYEFSGIACEALTAEQAETGILQGIDR